MAKLSSFLLDTDAMTNGAWVRVDERMYDDLEIRSRGFTDEFVDAQAARIAKAAEAFSGDAARIPNAKRREINAGLLRDFLVLGVRNLTNDDESEVTLEQFHALLSNPNGAKLARACWEAAGRVSTRAQAQVEAAVGNSAPGSASS